MAELISKLVKLALFLAAIGQLKPAILYFATEAAREQRHGLISLSKLNHALVDGGKVLRTENEHRSGRQKKSAKILKRAL